MTPHYLLATAVRYVPKGEALDVGAGDLADSLHLLKKGFTVTALDPLYNIKLEQFTLKKYNLINAHNSLPFLDKDIFETTWQQIRDSLNSGGLIVGQFFGKHSDIGNTFTKEEVLAFLKGMEFIVFDEIESTVPGKDGVVRHWHIFDFIVQK